MTRLNFLKRAVITAGAALILSSCEKEPKKLGCDCADELFYYYSDDPGGLFSDDPVFEKIFLDDIFLNDWLVVGIESQVQDEEIVSFINQTDLFKPVDASNVILAGPSEDDYLHIIFVNTKKPKTCSQLKEIIQTLEKSSTVAYAHLTFESTLHGELMTMDIMSFTNEVIVMLEDIDDLPVLNSITSETKTRIKSQSEYYPEQFTIAVDKDSRGNALQMANYFHETGKFKWASPNFLHAQINR